MSRPLNKCISLGSWENVLPDKINNYLVNTPTGGAAQTVPDEDRGVDPNTGKYFEKTDWTMVQELNELLQGGVKYVKFWVNWQALAEEIVIGATADTAPDYLAHLRTLSTQELDARYPFRLGRPPSTFAEQAQFMDTTKGQYGSGLPQPIIRYLDQSIRLANDNDVTVILAVWQNAPAWSFQVTTPMPEGKILNQHFPDELNADSPYGWFIQYLVARYTGDETGGPGCGCVPAIGNPEGAQIDYIEPLNEPNFEWWPQEIADDVNEVPVTYCKAAEAMTTCEWWCRFYAFDYDATFDPLDQSEANWAKVATVLGPSGADKTNIDRDGAGVAKNTGYADFTGGVLAMLAEWHPVMRVGWAHHNYHDIEERCGLFDQRVSHVATMLGDYDFLKNSTHLPNEWKYQVWLTEGTYRMGQGKKDWVDPSDEPYDAPYEEGVEVQNPLLGPYTDRLPVPDGEAPDESATPSARSGRGWWQARQRDAIRDNFSLMRDYTSAVLWTQHALVEENDHPTRNYGLREKMRRVPVNGPGRKRLAWEAFKALDPDPDA